MRYLLTQIVLNKTATKSKTSLSQNKKKQRSSTSDIQTKHLRVLFQNLLHAFHIRKKLIQNFFTELNEQRKKLKMTINAKTDEKFALYTTECIRFRESLVS